MQPHQLRILGRIADEIDDYRAGRRTMLKLLANAWGLFEAAEVRGPEDRDRFMDLYYALSSADDRNQPWMPTGLGSDEEVAQALVVFEDWARAIREQHEASET